MNRRWELAGLNPAVHRQMMGHSSETMTRLYSGEISLQDVASAFSKRLAIKLMFWKLWKLKLLPNYLILWSGLSESNRHLNLGKVNKYTLNAGLAAFLTNRITLIGK